MNVMSARMHYPYLLPAGVGGPHLAGIWQACLLGDRQGIEFSSQQSDFSWTIFKNSNHTRTTDARRDLKTKLAKAIRKYRCSLVFMARKLRVLVEIAIKRFRLRVNRRNLHIDVRRLSISITADQQHKSKVPDPNHSTI